MTIQIKHAFQSAKGDGGDATIVRPSAWNAAHTTSMASGKIIGRLTAGSGDFEEIPISAYMANLLGSADAAALASVLGLFETGDVKYTFKTTAASGWVLILGGTGGYGNTIGNAASGALSRANADCLNLFVLLYGACSDAIAPVSGGRSGNAVNDFNANKTIRVPNLVGRSPIGAGIATNDGTIARVLGTMYGTETHTLTIAELAVHYHTAGIYDPTHTHGHNINGISSSSTGGGGFPIPGYGTPTISAAATGVRVNSPNGMDTTYSAGSGAAHNNLHPVIALNAMVKL